MARKIIKIKRLSGKDGAESLPIRATAAAAGFDLMASNDKDIVIKPMNRGLVPTGMVIELPRGYEAQIRPRSGVALKYGVTVLNSPGTIDSDYRGEIKVLLINLGQEPFRVKKGDRIGQMVISQYVECGLQDAARLSRTARKGGGFGHTGLNSLPKKRKK